MSRIFISYRRDDTAADMTDRLYERFVRRWGRRVFMDIDSIVGGDLFAKAIDDNLQNCAVVVVMIGRYWVSLTDEKGARRIDDPLDYPRMEVAAALRRGIRVIPVLTGNVPLPKREELPEEIVGLLDRQYVRISRERFDADAQRLIDAVAHEMPRKSWRDFPWRAVAVALLVAGIATGGYFLVGSGPAPIDPGVPAVVPPPVAKGEPAVVAQKKPDEVAPPAVVTAPSKSLETKAPDAAIKGEPAVVAKKSHEAVPSAVIKAPPKALRDNSISSTNVSGKWQSPMLTSPYDQNRQYMLLFEFIHQGDTLIGTVTHANKSWERGFAKNILDGKIKGNVLSFYTQGEVWGWDNKKPEPFKDMYSGVLNTGKHEIAFQRLNDVSGGGEIERFVAKQK